MIASKSFVQISLECFALAEQLLPEPADMRMKAEISYSRASAILSATYSSQYQLAITEARTYVKQFPSFEGYTLLWKCCLRVHDCNNALTNFKKAQEIKEGDEEIRYKEFVKFFSTTVSQKEFQVFGAERPVPKYFVEKLITECVKTKAIENLSVLLYQVSWADDCEASCVPVDLVLEWDTENRNDLLKTLLERKAPAGGLPDNSKSPLTICLERDNLELALMLLEYGADGKDLVEEDGDSILHASLRIGLKKGNFAILKFFLDDKRYSVDFQDADGNTLLHLLCRGKLNAMKLEAMRLVLEAGANPLIINKLKKKPLDLISVRDNRRKLLSSAEENFKIDKSLDSNVAELNAEEKIDEAKAERSSIEEPKSLHFLSDTLTSPPSMSYAKSNNLRKETLAIVRERVLSLIKKLDVRDWLKISKKLKKVTPQEKAELYANKEEQGYRSLLYQTALVEEDDRTFQKRESNEFRVAKENTDNVVKLSSFEGLPWDVECTAKVWKILSDKRLESWMKERFFDKVRSLAQGRDNWTPHLCKRLEGLPKSRGMLLYETRLTDAARIIWECAVAFSPRYSDKDCEMKSTIYSETIRIWDIEFDHDNVSRTIENIVTSFTRGKGCNLRKELRGLPREEASQNQGPNLYVKLTEKNLCTRSRVKPEEEAVNSKSGGNEVTFFPPASHNDNEYQVLKFYHLSSAMIQAIREQQSCNAEIDFPFRVTEEEYDIINFKPTPQSSIILIGRSGTGKTTCILYRLWKCFLQYWKSASKSGPWIPKNTVFLPKESPSLSLENSNGGNDVKTTHNELQKAKSSCDSGVADGDCGEVTACCHLDPSVQIETGLEHGECLEHLHQLFVTKNGVLCQEIQKNFKALSQACPFVKHDSNQGKATSHKLQDVDDASGAWPLFLNARDFYIMLDASLPEPYFFPRNEDGSLQGRMQDWGEEGNQLSTIPVMDEDEDEDEDSKDDTDEEEEEEPFEPAETTFHQGRLQLVSYSIFENSLWPKMCKKKKHVSFHPSLVWMEIRSFIKGSYEALHTRSGYLSFEKYQGIGLKRASNFKDGGRAEVYRLFKSYEHFRKQSNMIDENDVVFDLYHRLRQCAVPDWSIHELYVDETQDFTQAELMLLIRCCRDPNAIFLTGDTAQSVMRGISFRFEDLGSLFFYLNDNYKAVGAQAEIVVPRRKQLVLNYRSHSGVLGLASSVVNILQKYFPESFDKLERDQGQLDGPKPVLLESCSPSDLAIILRGNKRETTTIEFGAHQVILVASNEARESLPEELSHALVLTIYEAKGLEFDDVLVYNFFKDSQACAEWRVVTQYLLEVVGCETGKIKSRPLTFNPEKHRILNSELKQLYTAVTRARANVWFFDENEENRRPVFEYFEQLGLANVAKLEADAGNDPRCGQALQSMFSKPSSPEEWEKQGQFFFSKKLWKVAKKCFTICGNGGMSQKCEAYVQADYARTLHSEPRRLKDEFLRAADQFLQCKMIPETKVCLYNARERALYASLLQKLGEEKDAIKWFEKAGSFVEASQCLEKLGNYKEAVEVLIRGNLYQNAVDVLSRFEKLSSGDQKEVLAPGRTLQELCLASAELSFKGGNMAKMHTSLKSVHPVEIRVEFLKKRKMLDDAAKELLKEGRAVEAAKLMREKGSFLVAVDYAKRSGHQQLAADCTLAHVRSSKNMPREEQAKHLQEAKNLYKEAGQMNGFAEVLLEEAKRVAACRKAIEAANIFKLSTNYNICGELECVEVMLDCTHPEHGLSDVNTTPAVRLVRDVLQLIKSLNASNLDVMTQKEIDRCEEYFGLFKEGDLSKRVIRRKEGDRFLYLAQGLQKRPVAGSRWEMDLQDVRERIAEILFNRVTKLIQSIRVLLDKTFLTHQRCQNFLVGFPCNSESCPHRHMSPSQNTNDALFKAILDEMYLDAQANDFQKLEKRYATHNFGMDGWEINSPNPTEDLGNLFPRDGFASCEKLFEFFFPASGQSVDVPLHSYICSFRDKTPWFFKQRLLKFAEEVWKKRATDEAKLQSADVFLTVSHLLQLIGSPSLRILSWIEETEDEFRKTCVMLNGKPIIPKTVGIALEGTKMTLFSRWWEMSKTYLHACGDILEAGHNAVRRFLSMTANPRKRIPYPTPKNCLDILEYFTCVFLTLFARLQQAQNSRDLVCLPASYLSVMSFWNTLNCTTSEHVEIYQAVFLYQSHPLNIRLVKKFLHDMVSLMLGGYSQNFNLLKKVLHCNESIHSGEAERALVLVLTLLCNSGQSVPRESELKLLENLYTAPPAEVMLPDRMALCLEKVRESKGIREIVVILHKLLRERGENLYTVQWENVSRQLWRQEVNPECYRNNFYTDVLERLAQTTEELPAEKVTESGDIEEGFLNELNVDEEHPTRDLDRSQTEKLEAIKRKEVIQAESWEKCNEMEDRIPEEALLQENAHEDPLDAYFSSFRVDQSGCGICNVRFSLGKNDNAQFSVEDWEKETEDNNPISSSFAAYLTVESHQAVGSPHFNKVEEFNAYRKLFIDEFFPLNTKLSSVLSQADLFLKTQEQQGRSMSILRNKMDEIERADANIVEITSDIQKHCSWVDLEPFKAAIVSLKEALKSCEEEILSENSQLRDGSRFVPSFVGHSSDWDFANEPDGKDGTCAHVPGLKKKK
ncbi:TPR and ankyrin repeat-containing protein 1-like [Stylophora pistillata]|uniref:TPR and ankyrin repeat-containing protein 1-like n=1 Tax=Stylophora pistillata TaxID=50429 RepID=UPI000C046AEA|nr:TPR and ankyrin repeat-containing protein 1-like [Stylophora pistillata]